MGTPATLKIDIVADVKKATQGIDNIERGVGRLGKLATGAAIAGGALVAGRAIVDLGGQMISAADEGQKLSRATTQLIETTGGAAGVSTKYLEDMAGALARTTGVSDDSIQAGQNMLLTFTSIRNEVDDGTGVFDRATKAALDLAGAGFGTMESNATQLGKALQDPTKGMSALTRSGVSFTQAEQDKIKALQESGQLLEAQQMVLRAVEGQVQGTAAASASATEKIGVVWDQAMETLGGALLPVIDKLLPVFADLIDGLVPALLPVLELLADTASTIIDALIPALEPLFPVIAELAEAIGLALNEALLELAPILPELTTALANIVRAMVPLIPSFIRLQTAMIPILPPLAELIVMLSELVADVLPLLQPVIDTQVRVLDQMAAAIRGVLDYIVRLIGSIGNAMRRLGDLARKIRDLPGVGAIGGFLGGLFSAPGSVPVGYGAPYSSGTSRAASSGGAGSLRVDVTGVGFDSLLTARAIAKQLQGWNTRNGITPVQWAHQNGGLPV